VNVHHFRTDGQRAVPRDRVCAGCGQSLRAHPEHHLVCRRCFGYSRLAAVLPQLIADVTAVRP
jgi:hypothetical protein